MLVLSTLGALVAVWSYASLLGDMIFRHKAQPLVTRTAVAFAVTLNCVSVWTSSSPRLADLATSSIYATLSVVVLAVGCVMLVRNAKPTPGSIRRVDIFCLATAMIGTILFALTGASISGVSFAILADLAAYTPTFRSAWQLPETQPYRTYLYGAVAAALAVAADLMAGGATVGSIFTVYLVIVDSALLLVISCRKRFLARREPIMAIMQDA